MMVQSISLGMTASRFGLSLAVKPQPERTITETPWNRPLTGQTGQRLYEWSTQIAPGGSKTLQDTRDPDHFVTISHSRAKPGHLTMQSTYPTPESGKSNTVVHHFQVPLPTAYLSAVQVTSNDIGRTRIKKREQPQEQNKQDVIHLVGRIGSGEFKTVKHPPNYFPLTPEALNNHGRW